MTTTAKPKSWRDVLPIHPAAEMFPMMSRDELRALAEDIKVHNLAHRPVVQCLPNGGFILLDGRNRTRCSRTSGRDIRADHAGLPFLGAGEGRTTPTSPYEYVISANIHRRHLTAEQKRDLIAKVLKATPGKSNRQIAETVKADHKTVASVRAQKEATGEIPQLAKTIGKDGKARKTPEPPAARKATTDCDHVQATPELIAAVHDKIIAECVVDVTTAHRRGGRSSRRHRMRHAAGAAASDHQHAARNGE